MPISGVKSYIIQPFPTHQMITSIISNNTGKLIHVVFADNLTGVGKTHELIESWKNALHYGPYLGYYVKGSKSWLIMNEGYTEIENETFQDYNTRITTDGHCHLGAIVGSNKNKKEFLIAKVCKWVK